MKLLLNRIIVLTKRCIKRPAFLILFGLFFVMSLIYTFAPAKSKSAYIGVVLLNHDTSSASAKICDELIHGNFVFKFYQVDNERSFIHEIESGKASFGYEFPENFIDSLASDDTSNKIHVYTSTEESLDTMANEIVFNRIFKYSSAVRINYTLKNDKLLKDTDYEAYLEDVYLANRASSASFDVYDAKNGQYRDLTKPVPLNLPLKRIAGFFILFTTLMGLSSYISDKEHNLFLSHPETNKTIMRLTSIVAFAFPAYIFSVILLALTTEEAILKMILSMTIYTLIMIIIAFLLGFIIKRSTVFSKVLPIYIILIIVFGGIFFDVSSLSPVMKMASYFFPTSYL